MPSRLRSLSWLLAAALLVLLPSAPAQGKDGKGKEAPAAPGHVEKLDALALTITLPAAFAELTPLEKSSSQIRARWGAKLGKSVLSVVLFVMPKKQFRFAEPEDVQTMVLEDMRGRTDASFAFEHAEVLSGKFGHTPLGALSWGTVHAPDGKESVGTYCVLGGLLEADGYSLEIMAEPALDEAGQRVVLDFLRKGLVYSGKVLDPKWSDEEHRERWLKDAPPELAKDLEKPVRTKHYIFLSNTKAAKQMGASMEEFHDTIRKTYPFEDVPGRRLMPVFLFRDSAEYHAFYAKQFKSTIEEGAKSKGVAYMDFYATYYDAPQDPVHIHEGTHQIFANRLHLGGGGSWFQEGVAEYICTRASDRTDAANAVKKGRHVKLAEFVKIESLLWSAKEDKKGGNEASSGYDQAALLIEFLREDKWSKDKFRTWYEAIGRCPRNNTVAIERATQEILGVDLAGLEAKWIDYCKKR